MSTFGGRYGYPGGVGDIYGGFPSAGFGGAGYYGRAPSYGGFGFGGGFPGMAGGFGGPTLTDLLQAPTDLLTGAAAPAGTMTTFGGAPAPVGGYRPEVRSGLMDST